MTARSGNRSRGFLMAVIGLCATAVGTLIVAPRAAAQETEELPVGAWIGTLAAGGANLRVIFHIDRDADGRLRPGRGCR